MTLVSISNLRLALGHATVLHDVSLSVGEGEIVGLLGPNGAGKTTTMLAALGLLRPLAGQVRTLGRDPWTEGPELRRRIGVLPDPNGFHDWMTAPDYLAFFAGLYGTELDAASVGRRLDAVGLTPRRGQAIGTFSRGMRQRLGLARALIADPVLLVLDEPTAGLDPRGRREMHDLLASLARRGVGVLLCTHLLDDVERLCARACFIAEGRTVAEGRIDALLSSHAGSQARFRLELSRPVPAGAPAPVHVRVLAPDNEGALVEVDPAIAPDAAWRELLFLGWPIVAIARVGGGLEDFYMDVVMGGQAAAWCVMLAVAVPYLWAVGSTGQNLVAGGITLLLLGTPVVLGFGFLALGLGARLGSARGTLMVCLMVLLLSASPLLLGPSLRQSAVGVAFDAVNPFSAALNAYDAVVIDGLGAVAQIWHAVIALLWLAGTAGFAAASVRRLER